MQSVACIYNEKDERGSDRERGHGRRPSGVFRRTEGVYGQAVKLDVSTSFCADHASHCPRPTRNGSTDGVFELKLKGFVFQNSLPIFPLHPITPWRPLFHFSSTCRSIPHRSAASTTRHSKDMIHTTAKVYQQVGFKEIWINKPWMFTLSVFPFPCTVIWLTSLTRL